MSKPLHVDDVIASISASAGPALRPPSGSDPGRHATPIVAGQYGALNAESIKEIHSVMTKRSLLPTAHCIVGQKARGTEAASRLTTSGLVVERLLPISPVRRSWG